MCPAGTYNDLTGAIDCLMCPVGFYCAEGGVIEPSICEPGTYTDTTGSTECNVCPEGYYCSEGSSMATACPEGTYSDITGATSVETCVTIPAEVTDEE
jgi:hypothetical protein